MDMSIDNIIYIVLLIVVMVGLALVMVKVIPSFVDMFGSKSFSGIMP